MAVDPLHLSAALLLRYVLVFARMIGFFSVLPVFGERTTPPTVRAGLAGFSSFVLLWVPAGELPEQIPLFLMGLLFAKELMVGLAVGYLGRLIFTAFQFAINALDVQMGLGFMELVDPGSQVSLSVLGNFLNTILLLLFIEVDGHHLLLRGLVSTFQAAPLGTAMPNENSIAPLASILGVLVTFAVQLALPTVLVLLMIDVAMGIVGRVIPQLNVFLVALPVKVMLGLATLSLCLPAMSTALGRALDVIARNAPLIVAMVR